MKKSKVNGESGFDPSLNVVTGASVGSPFGSSFGRVSQQPIIEEPEDDEETQARKSKKARRTVTIEEVPDDSDIVSPSISGSVKTMKKSLPVVVPSEIIEPKEGSSRSRSIPKSTNTTSNVNGNNNLKATNGGSLGKMSSLPREPSKLRKSFVAEDENENVEVKGYDRKGVSFAPLPVPTFGMTSTAFGTPISFNTTSGITKGSYSKTGQLSSNLTPQVKPLGVIQEKGDVKEYVRQLSMMDLPRFAFCRPDPGCVSFPGKTDLGVREMNRVKFDVMELPVRTVPRFDLDSKKRSATSVSSMRTVNGFGNAVHNATTVSPSTPTPTRSVGFNWAKAGMKPPSDPTKEGKWVCEECTLTNDDTKAVKCSYCDARRPEPKSTSSNSPCSSTAGLVSAPFTGFDWAKAGMKPPTDPTKEGKWICEECTLTNDNAKAVKCAYCDTRRPEPKASSSNSSSTTASTSTPSTGFDWTRAGMKPPSDPTKEGKWVCGECTLTNDDNKAVKCAYCDARRPESMTVASTATSVPTSTGFDWAKAGMKPPSDPTREGKWVCGECTLVNDDTKAAKCAYCDSRR